MKTHAWAAIALGLVLFGSAGVVAQESEQEQPVRLERNYPNPFNPETTIPFSLSDAMWAQDRPVVSVRIYNVLAQLVAIPVLQGTGERLDNLALDWNGTGRFEAFWDGKVLDTGREAASGVYVYQLIVDGRPRGSMKMTVIK